MKKLLLIIFCFSLSPIFGQVTNEGEPSSWSLVEEKSTVNKITMPSIDLESLRNEDMINDKVKNKPYRVGIPHSVDFGLDKGGFWTELDNGDRIWRILFTSKDAVHLSFNFSQFHLPEGGKIYLYTADRSDLLGAYTHTQNNVNNKLGTWFVNGDEVWIEYFEPGYAKGEGKLHISTVLHGYRLANKFQKNYQAKSGQPLNGSGDCNHDVECSIGADYQAHKDELKHSVAFLNMGNGFICSGGLVNNTAQNKKPYFLSANHCFFDGDDNPSDPADYSMRFNWISPNPVCAQATNSTDATINQTISGATLKAKNSKTDFLLVEINQALDPTWDITYAGWNRSTTDVPTLNVGIHHPAGDIMKVSRDNNGAFRIANQDGDQFWAISGTGVGNELGGGWEIGTTEGGSSGSLLFDQNGLVIGQLFGGLSACSGLTDNGAYDLYGRFGVSWDAGSSSGSRLKDWLDPAPSTGATTLPSLKSTLSVEDEEFAADIKIFPNPTNGTLQIEINNRFGDYSYEIFSVLGQSLRKNKITAKQIELSHLPSAMYFIKITEEDSQKYAVKKVLLNK